MANTTLATPRASTRSEARGGPGRLIRFGIVGTTGFVLDLAIFHWVLMVGESLGAAHIAGFLFASASNYTLNRIWVFPGAERGRYARFIAIGLLALILRGAVIAGCTQLLASSATFALVAGVAVASAVNYLGAVFFVFSRTHAESPESRWQTWAAAILAFSFALRLSYLGVVDLLPQEAYYWNYAQHPALSYLDHPPMTAWAIWLGTALLGDAEFGVRFVSYCFSIVAAGFLIAFARNLHGRHAARGAALLYGSLPAFLGTGFFATPDAGIVLGWTATLYFLERAVFADRRRAWIGAGVCLGFGLLAKYTIVLLVPATLAYLILDRRSRRILRRPDPYLACLIAALIFSPVIVWNARNDWASFAFQTTRRLASGGGFSLHLLALAGVVLLTPCGFALALTATIRNRFRGDPERARRRAFSLVLTLVPLSVFILYSLSHRVMKMSWTIPIWIAAVPAMSQVIWMNWSDKPHGWINRIWKLNAVASLLLIGGILHWFTLGLPGIAPRHSRAFPIAWKEMSADVDLLAADLARRSESTPLVIDGTYYYVASELAYYGRRTRNGVRNTSTAHLIGGTGLMYERWIRAEDWQGAPALFVSLRKDDLRDSRFRNQVIGLSALQERTIAWNGGEAGHYWYRTGRLRARRPSESG